ncbi:MAG: HlyD family efflux transporter periplasmic adaptor subunit [Acidobacteria bacterium]|nr:HlyD family efflux transporter periplasmic adaptor subunit [Acidobacteriota bacterium]
MKKRLLLFLIILAAAIAAGIRFYPRLVAEPPPDDTLLVSGNIETHESLLGFEVQGRIVELLIEEGQWVEEGAVIARLEDADFRQQVALDHASLRVRDAELALARAGSRRQEVAAAEQTIREAEADLEQREIDFKRAETLYREKVGSQEARDLAEAQRKRAEAVLQRTRERHDQIVEGTRPEEIAIARANVGRAREVLRLSRIQLGYTVLRAPTAGVVLVRPAELGEVVAPGTPVVTLADLDHVWLRGYISETDLGRIRWGQPATLRTDTYPDKPYRGRVSFIASKAEFTPKSIETHRERVTLVYRIKIEVENPNHELKPGMPADAVIETNSQ